MAEPIDGHSKRRGLGTAIVLVFSPGGSSLRPVCTMYIDALCSLRNCGAAVWCIVRTIENRSTLAASLGRYSQKWTPLTRVAVVPYSPRISEGASGLGSHVSCCEGPPD